MALAPSQTSTRTLSKENRGLYPLLPLTYTFSCPFFFQCHSHFLVVVESVVLQTEWWLRVSNYTFHVSIKYSFTSSQFVMKKKQLLERKRKLVDAPNVSGRRLNKHRMPLEIYQMRLMEIEKNDPRER